MDVETRERKIAKVMSEIAGRLLHDGPVTLNSLSAPFEKKEIGLFQIAFSRLEADGMIIKDSDENWRWNGPRLVGGSLYRPAALKARLYPDTNTQNLELPKVLKW